MTLLPTGIYKITNLKNNKVYIGQSENIYIRRRQHFTSLRSGRHFNKEMQKDYKKNPEAFRWDVVEYCGLNELNDREAFWIAKLNTIEKGYNKDWKPFVRKPKKEKTRRIKKYRKRY